MANEHNPDTNYQSENEHDPDMTTQPENEHDPDMVYHLEKMGALSDMAVGIRVRDARKSLYLTQDDLAMYLGVSPSYISLLERGMRPVTHKILGPLLRILNVSYNYLIMGTYPTDMGFVSSVCEASSYNERLKLERLLEKCSKSEYEMCYRLCSAYLETSRCSRDTTTQKPKDT